MSFKSVSYESLSFNPFTKIGREWALLTAGTEKGCNTMTVSWGGLGFIWNKPVATVYVRPQRYTKEFIDREDLFTLSFYGEAHKPALTHLGRVSGRDGDKVAEVGFTPVFSHGTAYFEEADLVLVCRKMYQAPFAPENFLDKEADAKNYPDHDYHDLYIAEIVDVLVKEA